MFLILILQNDLMPWKELVQLGPTVVLLALILCTIIWLAPVWKEVKIKELEMHSEDNVVKGELANALGQLANALKEIAVEQRRATEEVSILQRMNNDSADQLSNNVRGLTQRVDSLEKNKQLAATK